MYIYEDLNWWQFRYDSNEIMTPLSSLRRKQGELMGRFFALGFELQNEALLETLSLDTIKSSEIEGEQLNLEQVRSSISRHLGLPQAGLATPSHYIDGVVQMMLDATQHYNEPLTHERLFGWHHALFPMGMSGLYKIDVGKYRSHAMEVVSGAMGRERVHYEAPDYQCVPAEMDRLVKWVNTSKKEDMVLCAAIAHIWFVTIHPFDDGNGRIARALTDMLLARSDNSAMRFYSMSAAILQDKNRYYRVIEKTQHGDSNITEWILWFISCLDMALDNTKVVLESTISKAEFWQHRKADEFNKRQKKIINRLFDGIEGKMTTSKWAKMCKCSQDTALNDIRDLLKKDVLISLGDGRGTNYVLKK
ncbi:MAG: Fic family protein [Bacteroidia bacterium]|nr:Fic family protein [Bacteroidia bacterium]